MTDLAGLANLGTGVAYILGVGVLSAVLARRAWHADRELAWVFAGLVLMASSCGPHHNHLGEHFLRGELKPTTPDLVAIVVAFPFGAAWLYWQFNTVTGRARGDWLVPADATWPVALLGALCIYVVGAVAVAVGGANAATGQATVQLALLALYVVVGYLLWTGQFRRRRIEGHWSGKGLAIACIFPTCGVAHATYGLALADGRYPSDWHPTGTVVFDAWGVAVALFFIAVTVRERRATHLVDIDAEVSQAVLVEALRQTTQPKEE